MHRALRSACLITLFALLTASTTILAQSARPERITISSGTVSAMTTTTSAPVYQPVSAQAAQGEECSLITFEGLGNVAPIPIFDNISLPGWLAVIDSDAGGSGNIANEPSPSTIAFWLESATGYQEIVFANPVSSVNLMYTSLDAVRLEAYDEQGRLLTSAAGSGNYNKGVGDPGGAYNAWTSLTVESDGNLIAVARMYGGVDRTGIDNLEVCSKANIDSIELTQAIQEWQPLDTLKADLRNNGQPPVPIVANKPLALRVYMDEVRATTTARVQISGVASGDQTVELQPNCTPEESRRQQNNCRSVDFYFTPPAGRWTVTVKALDAGGSVVETHELGVTSVTTNPLTVQSVEVCDHRLLFFFWQCSDDQQLGSLSGFLGRVMPTHEIAISYPGHVVRRHAGLFSNGAEWWFDTVRDIQNLGNAQYYYGMIRPEAPTWTEGLAAGIPSRAAASKTSVNVLGLQIADTVVAHELGHSLGRPHSNNGAPAATNGRAPGCFATAQAGDNPPADWPFTDNRIRSGSAASSRLEVGFDVLARRAIDPENHFDLMSYCAPHWISPHTYVRILNTLRNSTQPNLVAQQTLAEGPFWNVSGVISPTVTTLAPLFTYITQGPSGEGAGTYRIEARASTGAVLFVRRFEPSEWHPFGGGEGVLIFGEFIPVQAEARSLVVLGPDNLVLATLNFTGSGPRVQVVEPTSASVLTGVRRLRWSVSDADSMSHTARILYSADGGGTWRSLGVIADSELAVDFDQLPGTTNGRLRVLVSDGVNTGEAVFGPFTVSKKLPTATISLPAQNTAYRASTAVFLRGEGYDPETERLPESAFSWDSDRDGPLGTGRQVTVQQLSPGVHSITLRVTDQDGNVAAASVSLTVDGTTPTVALTITPDGIPARCVAVTIDASDEGGLKLASVAYSFDGGNAWNRADVEALPLRFTMPGSGFFHLVVGAEDASGNVALADERFFIDSPCPNQEPHAAIATTSAGEEGRPITLDGRNSTDNDGSLIIYEWDLNNDGAYDDAIGSQTAAVFDDNGIYTVGLRVTDDKHAHSFITSTLTVENTPPLVVAGAELSGRATDLITLKGASFSDLGARDTHRLTVTWGDGTNDSFALPPGAITAAHSYKAAGKYTVKICVTDNDGDMGCASTEVTVTIMRYPVFLPLIRR